MHKTLLTGVVSLVVLLVVFSLLPCCQVLDEKSGKMKVVWKKVVLMAVAGSAVITGGYHFMVGKSSGYMGFGDGMTVEKLDFELPDDYVDMMEQRFGKSGMMNDSM